METPVFPRHKKKASRHPNPFEVYWTKRRMWIAVTWAALVAAVSVGYYFFAFIPAQEKAQEAIMREQQALQQRIEQAKLDQEKAFHDEALKQQGYQRVELESCLQTVENNYQALWDQECADRGLSANCRLPDASANSLNDYYKNERDNCFKRFPQT